MASDNLNNIVQLDASGGANRDGFLPRADGSAVHHGNDVDSVCAQTGTHQFDETVLKGLRGDCLRSGDLAQWEFLRGLSWAKESSCADTPGQLSVMSSQWVKPIQLSGASQPASKKSRPQVPVRSQ